MSRRWTRRGAAAAGLSVAFHLLFLASGIPWSAPSLPPSLEMAEVEIVERRSIERPIDEPLPQSSRPEPPIVQKAARLSPPALASPAVEIPSALDLPRLDEPREPPPRPPIHPQVPPIVPPTIPTARDAARRHVALDTPRQPTEVALVTNRVNSLLEGYLRPRLNDVSPMPELRLDAEGNLVHENGALLATIRPDGSVVFGRNRGASVDGLGRSPDPVEQEILDMHTRIPGIPLLVRKATEGDCARGSCEDKAGLGVTIRPHSDLNDMILRAKGDDPLAAKKRRFLRLTEELRDQMAAHYEKHTLSRSKLRAGRHLERLWSNPSLDHATKRRTIFQLWDECEELLAETDLREEAKAGQRSRSHIIRFVRKHLPLGNPDAFTAGELRRLNDSRESRQLFSPYE